MTARTWAVVAIFGLLTACGSGTTKTDASVGGASPVCTGDLSQASAELQNAYPLFQRRAEDGPTREYALADGRLLHLAASNPRDSRLELMMALAGRMGRADAAAPIAALAQGEGSTALRWGSVRLWGRRLPTMLRMVCLRRSHRFSGR